VEVVICRYIQEVEDYTCIYDVEVVEICTCELVVVEICACCEMGEEEICR
jgi:hypothetical protein